MVDPDDWCPCRVSVAILAQVGGLDMLAMLAGCRRSIVATGAVTGHIGMIEVCWYPAIGCMTVGADITALDVIRRLACCVGAIMAT